MRVYLIAPIHASTRELLVSDKIINIDERYTIIAAAGITTVAAYFDDSFSIRLCDELIEDVDFDDPSEIICISMNVAQVARGLEIAKAFKAMGRTVILGGAHVSLAPQEFEGKADCIVVGEFEPVAEAFIADLKAAALKPRYDGQKSDMTNPKIPRWDLYPNHRAIWGVVQTSRGCPFECEFCDVIQYLGRVQRHKPTEAVLRELQNLYDLGYRQIHLSDDNFTVYRQRCRALLEALKGWNGHEGRAPVSFMTQMSMDIARDDGLLQLCNQAGVRDVFIGIETSNEEALKETKKRQNLKQDLVAQVEKITRAGLFVTSGMMVGFDNDHLDCFERQFDFGMALPVVMPRVTVLVAPIATPLYARMKRDGRLMSQDTGSFYAGSAHTTNIAPMNMTREQLTEGAQWLIRALMAPDNAIKRFERLAAILAPAPAHLRPKAKHDRNRMGGNASLALMGKAAKTAGGRRVIEAVAELARKRPEIAPDLTTLLASYLNTYVSLFVQASPGPNLRPSFMKAPEAASFALSDGPQV